MGSTRSSGARRRGPSAPGPGLRDGVSPPLCVHSPGARVSVDPSRIMDRIGEIPRGEVPACAQWPGEWNPLAGAARCVQQPGAKMAARR